MKALSLWQPWATLIANGAKQIETRSWSTSYRGPILIHAAKRKVLKELKELAEDSAPPDQALSERGEELGQLLSIISSQAEKLEAANYRIGYLQSKVENQEEQIKLLMCSKRSTSWWQSFCNWMLGRTPSSNGSR